MSDLPACALVLTAGRGTRLLPLTLVRAKPAVPVAGIPLVERIIGWLAARGIHDLVLNLHYKPESVARLVGDGTALHARVRYSWEPTLLGSGGGPARALPLLDADRFFIINGDTLTDIDLARLAETHGRSGARVTLALTPNPDPARYGGVLVDDDGAVTGFTRAGDRRPSAHFVGVQLVERDVFAGVRDDEPSESVGGRYRAMLAERGTVRAFLSDAAFHDIGTPHDYLSTSAAFARAEGHGETLPIGSRSRVAASASIVRTAIWDDVEIGADVELVDCVVTDGVCVPAGVRLHGQIVWSTEPDGAPPGETVRLTPVSRSSRL